MKSDHSLYQNVISLENWPKLPKQAPPISEPASELELAIVVRDVVEAVLRDGKSQPVERQVRLRNFRSESYKLVDDLVVSLEEQSDYVAARSYDTGQYAYGPSVDDALGNLCSTIEEYYELLREERDNLSRPLAAHLQYLDAVLEKI
jgi:hypothetical protein